MKQRSDGRWEKVITIEGKRVHFYSTEQTEKKATSDINRQLLQYHDELHRVKHNFGAIVQCVLERKYDEVEEATYKSYLYASLKLESLFKDDIEDITPVRFNAVLDDLASKKYSRSGISKVKILASLACEEAILNGINIQNFAKENGYEIEFILNKILEYLKDLIKQNIQNPQFIQKIKNDINIVNLAIKQIKANVGEKNTLESLFLKIARGY